MSKQKIEVLCNMGDSVTGIQYKEIETHRPGGPLCLRVMDDNGEGFYIELYTKGLYNKDNGASCFKVWAKPTVPRVNNYIGCYYPKEELVLTKLGGKVDGD